MENKFFMSMIITFLNVLKKHMITSYGARKTDRDVTSTNVYCNLFLLV